MENHNEILKQHVSEQIALEEHLYKIIQDQILEIDENDFDDAKSLLTETSKELEQNFIPLNELLDKLEKATIKASDTKISNGWGLNSSLSHPLKNRQISKLLRDDYSALNLITMNNTLLHTTALALDSEEVAIIALRHLENLAPLVVKIGKLVPEVVARELRSTSPTIDLSVAQTALKNSRLAWRKAS